MLIGIHFLTLNLDWSFPYSKRSMIPKCLNNESQFLASSTRPSIVWSHINFKSILIFLQFHVFMYSTHFMFYQHTLFLKYTILSFLYHTFLPPWFCSFLSLTLSFILMPPRLNSQDFSRSNSNTISSLNLFSKTLFRMSCSPALWQHFIWFSFLLH